MKPEQITVTLHKARDIEKKGMFGKADPYVIISFGKDNTLGNKTIDINQIQENKKMLNQWIPLENCKSGSVLFSAEFIL